MRSGTPHRWARGEGLGIPSPLLGCQLLAGFAGDDAPRAVFFFFSSILLVQQTVEFPQLQFICVVGGLPVVTHMPSLMVQTARRTIEIPQLLVYKVVNVPVMRDVQVPRVRRGEDSCSLSCSSLRRRRCRLVATVFLPMMLMILRGTALCRRREIHYQFLPVPRHCWCVAMSSGGESFSPDDAYDSAWDSVMPTKGNTLSITSSPKRSLGVFAC